MVQHFGPRSNNHSDGFPVALKVGNENFHAAAGGLAANLVDHHGEDPRRAQQIVIAVHAGNHCVEQP